MFQCQLSLPSLFTQVHCSHYADGNTEAQSFHLRLEFPGMAMGFKSLAVRLWGGMGGCLADRSWEVRKSPGVVGGSHREQGGAKLAPLAAEKPPGKVRRPQ